MKRNTRLRKLIKDNREGSYIVEAAVVLPLFIISVAALLHIILIISKCEEICFYTALEMKDACYRSCNINESVSLCKRIEKEVNRSCNGAAGCKVSDGRYFYWDSQMEVYDLISVEVESEFNVINPAGINGNILFNGKILARGFTGSMQDSYGMGEAGFSDGESKVVYVFPRYGEKYHGYRCYYIENAEKEGSVRAMEEEDAKRRGYTACLVCGGG